jgi:chromosomal replication initiation ATPase DnaA
VIDADVLAAHRARLAAREYAAFGPIASLINRAAYLTEVEAVELRGGSRNAEFFKTRCAIAYVAKKAWGKSESEIGRALGGRDHSTIHSSLKRAHGLLKEDGFQRLVAALFRFTTNPERFL